MRTRPSGSMLQAPTGRVANLQAGEKGVGPRPHGVPARGTCNPRPSRPWLLGGRAEEQLVDVGQQVAAVLASPAGGCLPGVRGQGSGDGGGGRKGGHGGRPALRGGAREAQWRSAVLGPQGLGWDTLAQSVATPAGSVGGTTWTARGGLARPIGGLRGGAPTPALLSCHLTGCSGQDGH